MSFQRSRQSLSPRLDSLGVRARPMKEPFGLRMVPEHFRCGVRRKYPVCCVVHFCWDNALGRASAMTRWKQIRHLRSEVEFVPCGILHAGGSTLPLSQRLASLFRVERDLLKPTQAGVKLRTTAAVGSALYRNASIEQRRLAIAEEKLEALWWGH